jgi:hypothetical protein
LFTTDTEKRKSLANNPLPETGYLRLKQIIGDPKANPPVPPSERAIAEVEGWMLGAV